jgi:general secretion pathway protein K
VDFSVQDQAGLIDLNAADEKLLAIGLQSIGVRSDQIAHLARAVLNFRGFSASANEKSDGVIGGPKSGPFESVVELSDFADLSDVPTETFRRSFTVHSGKASVVDASKPPHLLVPAESVVQDEVELPAAFTIEVVVKKEGNATGGYSGFLYKRFDESSVRTLRQERLVRSSRDTPVHESHCPDAIYSDLTRFLRRLEA